MLLAGFISCAAGLLVWKDQDVKSNFYKVMTKKIFFTKPNINITSASSWNDGAGSARSPRRCRRSCAEGSPEGGGGVSQGEEGRLYLLPFALFPGLFLTLGLSPAAGDLFTSVAAPVFFDTFVIFATLDFFVAGAPSVKLICFIGLVVVVIVNQPVELLPGPGAPSRFISRVDA